MKAHVQISVGRSIQVVRPAIVLPRMDDGGDHGTERKLLARVGPIKVGRASGAQRSCVKELIWSPGAKHWAGNLAGYVYKPGHLIVSSHFIGGTSHALGNEWLDSRELGATRLDAILKLPRVRDWVRLHVCERMDYNDPQPWTAELIDKLDARATVLFHLERNR